jgi:hypothetical protein
MALYSIGATWNPRLSQPNKSLQRQLAGLYGIRGLNFAYRLNTWGPKEGPPMLPANTFPAGSIPPDWQRTPSLSSPFTWMEGVLGIEAPADMATDAANTLNDAVSQMTGSLTAIQTLVNQAQAYSSSSDQAVLAKAQACLAEGAGLVSTYQTLQAASGNLQTQITTAQADPGLTKDTAQGLKDAAAAFAAQVATYVSGVKQFSKDVSALSGAAQSGPGVTGYIENLVSSSTSKLTWIIGGGLMIYFLAPTFIPRMIRGARKAA